MFGKKGIDKVLSDLKKYFAYLFDDGFQIVGSKYDEKHFGNWMTVLYSNKCIIRIHQDRRQIVILIGPPWASTNMQEIDHYYDLKLIVAFLEKNESVDFTADLQHIDLQYEEISRKLLAHYEQVVQLVNRPDFANVEKELYQLQERVLAKKFPGLFGKKS